MRILGLFTLCILSFDVAAESCVNLLTRRLERFVVQRKDSARRHVVSALATEYPIDAMPGALMRWIVFTDNGADPQGFAARGLKEFLDRRNHWSALVDAKHLEDAVRRVSALDFEHPYMMLIVDFTGLAPGAWREPRYRELFLAIAERRESLLGSALELDGDCAHLMPMILLPDGLAQMPQELYGSAWRRATPEIPDAQYFYAQFPR